MNEKLTIVIPTFNRKDCLRVALDSVINQLPIEACIIVSDNCSTDGTKEMVCAINHPRIKYFFHNSPVTSMENWDSAFSLVKTELVSFLGDDDWYGPNFIQDNLKVFSQFPEVVCSVSGYTRVDSKGLVLGPFPNGLNGLIEPNYFAKGCLNHKVFFTTSVFKTIELRKVWKKSMVDIDFDYRALLYLSQCGGRFYSIPKVDQVFVRYHSNSCSSLSEKKIMGSTYKFLKEFLASENLPNILSTNEIRKELSYWSIMASRKCRNTDYSASLFWALRAIYFLPIHRDSWVNLIKACLLIL